VDILVVGAGSKHPRADVGVEGVQTGDHPVQFFRGQQAGGVQHPCVRPRAG
jgi:hypothetical protein